MLLVAALTVLMLVPFLGKAFHVDDTLFLKAARQIRSNPLDFYGFSVNWYGTEQPMSDVMKNPPLAAYLLALASAAAGWTETALHAAFLLPAVAAALGVHALARRLTARPGIAALAAIATPAFLVSSTNVMCDTLMLALWVWAVERWLRGVETGRGGALVAAGALAALAALTKYFGAAIVPLLFTYGLAKRQRLGAWAIPLLVPIGALAGYQLWTESLYGRGLLFDAATYASGIQVASGSPLAVKTLIGLSFAGGSLASAAFFAPWLWRGHGLGAAAIVGGILATILAAAGNLGGFALASEGRLQLALIAQITVLAVAGAGLLALAVGDLARRRDADSLLLFLWVAGTFVFAVFLNWTVNARSFLPAAPAAGILVARRLELLPAGNSRLVPALALLVSTALALAVARADAVLAGCARTAAARISATPGRGALWFEGHWGFQHYMEAAGAKPLDRRRSRPATGDRVAIAVNNTNVMTLPGDAVAPRETILLPVTKSLATLSPPLGAGFYLDSWGPLPFAFGRVPAERYVLLGVVRDVAPGEIGR